MPPARPKYQKQINETIERAVDVGVDAVFDRLGDFFTRSMDNQRAQTQALPPETRRATYKCSGCHKPDFTFEQMAMVSTKNDGWGTCEGCFKFMWHAGNEKMLALKRAAGDFAKGAARAATGQPRTAAGGGPLPHEILGVDIHASNEEINKAYRALALQWHPDRVLPEEPTEKKDMFRAEFEKIQRAYEVMKKVRKVAT